ncbi:MAG: metallophosphoesterase [Planctomycetota bacterium]
MRLAILADCHVSSPNAPDGEENHAHGLGMLERAVDAIGKLDVDSTIIVGDLVNMGYEEEYADAKGVLEPLLEFVTVIPGNHEMVKGNRERFVKHFGEPVGRLPLGEVFGLTLNTAQESMDSRLWFGELDAASKDEVKKVGHREPLLVFLHHPFENTVRSAPYPMMYQINHQHDCERLIYRGAPTVVFTGHAHRADLRRIGNCTFVGCPPLCFWPHAFLIADLDETHLHVRTHRLVEDVADSPDPKTREGERHLTAEQYIADCEPPVPSFSIRVR